ncbi:MAG TPA: TolC family protein [Candidatus Hydrogenedentes bacterium]|nr:TolC family protein [Candidatus Hydrogenedentota bacterium]
MAWVEGHRRFLAYGAGMALIVALVTSCTAARYSKKADRETYRIINEKSKQVPNMEKGFSLEKEAGWDPLAGLPLVEQGEPAFGAEEGSEVGASIISLEKALEIAVKNSRTYQNEKESLYLGALGLTLDRHQYTPIFSAKGGGAIQHSTRDVEKASKFTTIMNRETALMSDFESLTGTPGTLLRQFSELVESSGNAAGLDRPHTKIVYEKSIDAQTNLNVGLLLRGGGKIALGLTSDFMRFLTGESRVATGSVLTGSYTQPLLRGRGAKIAAESLTQSERDVLYDLRDFTLFRKDFCVEVCSNYYQVLQNRDAVRNNWKSLEAFKKNAERERAFSKEGRRTQAELGRLEQAELNTESQWVNSVRRYKENLDQFKIKLGLSTDAKVVLDDRELSLLHEHGIQHPNLSAEDAVSVALATRLDYYTEKDRTEDAARKVKVAKNALQPNVDLSLQGQVPSKGKDGFQNLDFERTKGSIGLDVDLGIDRKAERNAYRAAVITHERALRNLELKEDNIKLEVRAAWRDLDQARRNYEIAKSSVALSQRRVEEQNLLSELGRATVLNQVDAQNDLTSSQNELTAALVSHTIARLSFWRDMGILYIKPNGQWEEVSDELRKERAQQ